MAKLHAILTDHKGAAIIIFLYVLLAGAYNLDNPLFESPDEHHHYRFIRYLQTRQNLPVVDYEEPPTEYHQPPLYYALTALITAPLPHGEIESLTVENPFWGYAIGQVGRDNKNRFLHDPGESPLADPARLAVHLTRALSTLYGAAALLLVYLLAREFLRRELALAALAAAAFIPNLLLTTASVTNDSLAMLLSAAILYVLVRLVTGPEPPSLLAWGGLSVLLGLAALTKLNIWPLLPLSALAVLLLAIRFRSWRLFLIAGVILLGGVGLLSGWWIVRNLRLYGDFTGLAANAAVWGARGAMTPADYLVELRNLCTTFWSNFGYGNVPAPGWVYSLLDVFMLGGVVGLVTRLWKHREPGRPVMKDAIILLLVYIGMIFFGLLWSMPRQVAVTGRHFYPALPVIAIGLVSGWSALAPEKWGRVVAAVIPAGMLLLAVGMWGGVLRQAYRPSPRLADLDTVEINRLGWQYGDRLVLAGYTVEPEEATPGETVDVTLYWVTLDRPERNYTVFVHLLDGEGGQVGARDTYPGLGNDPTIFWPPGQIIADTIPVPVSADARGPILLDIEAGLYDLETGERLPITDPAGNAVGYPVVGQLKLSDGQPEKPAPQYELDADFQGGLRLEGYDLLPASPGPGETISLALYWSPAGPLPADYTVFIHLLDQVGALVTQGDAPPLNGRYPTTFWAEGEYLQDVHIFGLLQDMPSGTYEMVVGLYDPVTGLRLPLVNGGDAVTIGVITIRGKD